MNARSGLILVFLAALPACSLFDDSDPREGEETVEACAARLIGSFNAETRSVLDKAEKGSWTPTYTYDVTKMDLEALKVLMVDGSDDTAGRRLTASTNELSTAVARFKAEPVDEKGAFFMGHDPALYRVRGEPARADQLVAAGCARQQADMRLIDLTWAPAPRIADDQPDGPDAATENENDS